MHLQTWLLCLTAVLSQPPMGSQKTAALLAGHWVAHPELRADPISTNTHTCWELSAPEVTPVHVQTRVCTVLQVMVSFFGNRGSNCRGLSRTHGVHTQLRSSFSGTTPSYWGDRGSSQNAVLVQPLPED